MHFLWCLSHMERKTFKFIKIIHTWFHCFIIMPSLAISNQRHSVFWVSVWLECDYMLKVCKHNISQTACWNFTKFTVTLLLSRTKMNWLDFEVTSLKFKVMIRSNNGQKSEVRNVPFWWRHTGRQVSHRRPSFFPDLFYKSTCASKS